MKIGIPAQEHGEVFGVNIDYLTLIEEIGGSPVILYPMEWEEFCKTFDLDGLVLPGGSDVNPWRYRHIPHPMSYKPNQFLEYFDLSILPRIIGTDFPIFGICRGLQTLNVHFGGTLYQHLWRHPYSSHKQDLVHEIIPVSGKKFKVNSFHHQAIWKVGREFDIIAQAGDKTIEAIYHHNLPIAAVQWHPERIRDDYSIQLMKSIFS